MRNSENNYFLNIERHEGHEKKYFNNEFYEFYELLFMKMHQGATNKNELL